MRFELTPNFNGCCMCLLLLCSSVRGFGLNCKVTSLHSHRGEEEMVTLRQVLVGGVLIVTALQLVRFFVSAFAMVGDN